MITREDIDAIVAFLPAFTARDFSPGQWCSGEGYSAVVDEFVSALYKHNFVLAFDWSSWQEEAQRFIDDKSALAAADLETIQKLLTFHVRQDRFCEGHLASMFERCHIVALLERLKALTPTVP